MCAMTTHGLLGDEKQLVLLIIIKFNDSFAEDRRDGVVVRASASQSIDLEFIS